MPASPATSAIHPGFITLHGNQSEWLAHTVMQWLRSTPLPPLEQEVVLVQSNGMAEWFKMEMARLSGACAATRVELPSRFLWRTYRQVLGAAAVPRESPLDKLPMTWRLMKVLPALLEQPDFAPVERYLREYSTTHERDLPLAAKLADLFDQYQNYRADWLQAWGQGQDVLLQHDGRNVPIPDEQRWQPQLWRAVLGTLAPGQEQAIRPYLHQRALARLRQQDANFTGRVARRVVVFGMSHMPLSTLQALAALSPYTQVILAIPNPCRYYWGDIIEGRELFRTLRRRQQARNGLDLGQVDLQDMHQHAHPLLAAWGRQGRDFIRLLDEVDSAEQTQQQFPQLRLDVFDETPASNDTPMLRRVQQAIRDLEPLDPQLQQTPWPWQASDRSISFHIAHNPVRELEILHDQLLTWLAETNPARPPLQPRDIVVMVPDIGTMAPAIRAVFEQYKASDPRYIPYDIADVSAQATSPLMTALEWLLKLPHQRCGMSELLDLLEVPAIAQRFGVSGAGLPQLKQWMQGAGIRWGLNQQHRSQLGLAACGEQNSAWFGLQRMLLAYATGALPSDPDTTAGTPWAHIVPYTEVGGLEAEWAGSLAHLLQTLMDWVTEAATPASPTDWAERGRVLLDGMFRPSDDAEQAMLERVLEGLNHWLQACAQAGFEQPLLLADFRSAWLEAIDPPSLDEKFRAGGVTFCTLMPMRAIPFEVVCLLGMNDGDYPRRSLHSDFDLMHQSGQYRPGDRSRQHDDRQLMLEALLSARRALYISWTGRSVRDNTEQPPSVLVSQLRDYLSACWGQPVLEQLTTEYPLQAFSRSYFVQGSTLHTYAHEWRSLHHTEQAETSPSNTLPPLPAFVPDPQVPLTLGRLTQFLRNPVKVFFRERLSIVWPTERVQDHDVEPLASDGLEHYQWIQQQIDSWPPQASSEALRQQIEQSLQRQRQAGVFQLQGLGQRQQDSLQQVLLPLAHAWVQARQNYPHPAPRQALQITHGGVLLQDWLEPLYTSHPHTHPVWLQLEPSKLLQKDGKSARPDKLLPVWLRLLAAAASGQKVSAVVVGQDARLDIEAIEPELAAAQWPLLLELWLQGMQRPMPLPLRTALAYVANQGKDPEQAAATAYEGSDYSPLPGEGTEPCLAREFPDFSALQASGEFAQWAETLYAPLLQWLPEHVHCHPHSTVLEPAAHADT